jgi:hypothetical protein
MLQHNHVPETMVDARYDRVTAGEGKVRKEFKQTR